MTERRENPFRMHNTDGVGPPIYRAEPPETEYTAQCWGGPMHGEPVSACVTEWSFVQAQELMLDGPVGPATRNVTRGKYVFTVDLEHDRAERWVWHGPGADGDTIERLRLR